MHTLARWEYHQKLWLYDHWYLWVIFMILTVIAVWTLND